MQELTSEASDTYRRIAPHKVPPVPVPRSPNAMRVLLGQYATALFESEAIHYPGAPDFLHWLKKLGERVTSRVLNSVAQVEHAGSFRFVSLTYHNLPLPEMEKAIVSALKQAEKAFAVDVRRGPIEATKQSVCPEGTQKNLAETRKAFIEPMLTEKGWSILQWAMEAEVAYNTVADYVSGKKNPYPSTRVKLAKALGVSANRLPQ